MTTTTSATIDRLEDRYRLRFAGHPRVSRDPEELEKIVADLAAIDTTAEPELVDRISGLRDMYTREITAIQDAIKVPFAVPAARLRMWADLTMSRYARKFAGQDRRTRDVAILDELVADLQGVRTAMARVHGSAPEQRLDEALVSVDRALATYKTESEAVRTTRRTGSLGSRAPRFAQLANAQFETYALHFAKQPRISRHPPILQRILRALDEIRRGMLSLKIAGFNERNNDKNLEIVDDRIEQYNAELDAIRTFQADAALDMRVGSLGTAANEVFAMYRELFSGKQRDAVDPQKLDELFERLWPISREMDQLDSDHDDETNGRNLRLVTDNLLLYSREYEQNPEGEGVTGIPAPEPPPPRRTERPLPAHRYLPGVGPNPSTLGWAPVADFDYACDLFDHRHYWEAHEVWEAEWRPLANDDPEKWLLQGLICGAAFTIKRHQGFTEAAGRILVRCRTSLDAVVAARGPAVRGLDLPELLARLDRFRGGGPWPVLPPA